MVSIRWLGLCLTTTGMKRGYPTWEEVRSLNDEGRESEARVTCELARTENEQVASRLMSWDPSELREASIAMFSEMERQLAACSIGAWDEANASRERVNAYLSEFCDQIAYCSGVAEGD